MFFFVKKLHLLDRYMGDQERQGPCKVGISVGHGDNAH